MALTRKHFIQGAIGAAGAAALGACGDDSGSGGSGTSTTGPTGPVTIGNGPSSTTGTMMGCGTNIGTNHASGAHSMTVSSADVNAGVDKTYDITGASMHSHMVTITAADFQALAASAGAMITVTSTTGGGHTHEVTVTCTV
jgi:hypothetical protein